MHDEKKYDECGISDFLEFQLYLLVPMLYFLMSLLNIVCCDICGFLFDYFSVMMISEIFLSNSRFFRCLNYHQSSIISLVSFS